MTDVPQPDRRVNLPEVVAEITDIFERYEAALATKDVDVLDNTFWNSPHTIRYAMHENGYGFDEIHAHRVRRPAGINIKQERLKLVITTIGTDFATTNLEFRMPNGRTGRQSQTFVKFPDAGWKVVAAHVSTQEEKSLW
ncbi:oxalurate catabolism protein HpxZ [Thalassobaculum sp. OXR-137]|uniref:oxalurate catabolism protein HpxZ n=1 Tax=Thalassobaculum sp. OXR-137 TaxID=3100173 RepID=UPI002AC95126|nr:oxalurate catabolism protein HpxZ [Thalassobaculum sp. OXR-137]WPZ32945.1 oxalurate catabolism protein HpxZ [Thalassobaculum sp. OXR-137]